MNYCNFALGVYFSIGAVALLMIGIWALIYVGPVGLVYTTYGVGVYYWAIKTLKATFNITPPEPFAKAVAGESFHNPGKDSANGSGSSLKK